MFKYKQYNRLIELKKQGKKKVKPENIIFGSNTSLIIKDQRGAIKTENDLESDEDSEIDEDRKL